MIILEGDILLQSDMCVCVCVCIKEILFFYMYLELQEYIYQQNEFDFFLLQ